MATTTPISGQDLSMTQALRKARLAEAAHFEANLAMRDAASIRLQLLKDDLAPVIAASPEAGDLFDLALVPGEPPRLWVDLITFVVMEPDPRSYRLLQDHNGGRDILLETGDRAEMAARIHQHMAHRIVARHRQITANPPPQGLKGYSAASVMLAWIAGFALGVLSLLVAAILLGKLDY